MYNRYIREGGAPESLFSPVLEQRDTPREEPAHIPRGSMRLGGLFDGVFEGLGGLFGRGGKGFSLNNFIRDLELGDLILIAILVLMFLEGDNYEIIIVLGLVLLLGI